MHSDSISRRGYTYVADIVYGIASSLRRAKGLDASEYELINLGAVTQALAECRGGSSPGLQIEDHAAQGAHFWHCRGHGHHAGD
jgi:hypothetical protein